MRVRPLFRCRLRTFSSPACWFAWQPPIGQRTRGQPVGTHHPGRCPSALLSGLDNAIRLPRAPFRWWMRRQDTCFLSSFAGSRLTPGVRAWPPPGEWPDGGPRGRPRQAAQEPHGSRAKRGGLSSARPCRKAVDGQAGLGGDGVCRVRPGETTSRGGWIMPQGWPAACVYRCRRTASVPHWRAESPRWVAWRRS